MRGRNASGAVLCDAGCRSGQLWAGRHDREDRHVAQSKITRDIVLGYGGWTLLPNGSCSCKLIPTVAPAPDGAPRPRHALDDRLCRLLEVGQPKPGPPVVVAAASGAVGSVVGSPPKSKDAMRSGSPAALKVAASSPATLASMLWSIIARHIFQNSSKPPKGIDVYFEQNVWRRRSSRWCGLGRRFCAHPCVCGLIAQYNATTPIAYADVSHRHVRYCFISRTG